MEVGWLPVRDMIPFHSLIQAKKTLETENPRYLYEKLVGEKEPVSRYMTRLKVGVIWQGIRSDWSSPGSHGDGE